MADGACSGIVPADRRSGANLNPGTERNKQITFEGRKAVTLTPSMHSESERGSGLEVKE